MSKKNICRVFRLFSFVIPIVILCIYFIWKGLAPFGDNTFLIHDMNAQYINFYAYLKSCLAGKNNFVYSFSRGLGGDFPSFFAYYLTSPFNIITMLFPDELMPVGINLEMLFLFGLSGAACYYSLEYLTKSNYKLMLLFFSSAYSLSGWMVLNAENFQFIPEAAVLPMVVVSCKKMKETGKMWGVVFWLAVSVILNFYIGYMIFIFTFLWLFTSDGRKFTVKNFGVFILAALISMPVWFPVLRQFSSTWKSTEADWYTPNINFSLLPFLKKFLPGQFDFNQYMDDGLPAVYCSLITIVSSIVYFITDDDLAVKRQRAILLIILFVSLIFQPLTMVWQGFSKAHWWPYRFSFLLIYLLVLCAASSKKNIPWFILLFGIAGMIYNLFITFDVKLINAEPLSVYSEFVHNKKILLDSVDNQDELFRIEDLHPRNDNDAMFFSYAGITHFDSFANGAGFKFLSSLGFPQDRGTLQYGLGNTEFANSLLGVRYVIDGNEIRYREIPASYAYLLPENVSDKLIAANGENSVDYQNAVARALGYSSDLLTPAEVVISTENIECDEHFCWKPDPAADGFFIYEAVIPEGQALYAYADDSFLVGKLYFLINDERISITSPDGLIPLKKAGEPEKTEVRVLVDSVVTDKPVIHFYTEDPKNVAQLFSPLMKDITVKKMSSSELQISLPSLSEPGILLVTLPYDSRWKASSGGEVMKTKEIWDIFLGIEIPAGNNELRLKYR